ncbi:hypothetical protein RYX36_012981 [Vicia faba]
MNNSVANTSSPSSFHCSALRDGLSRHQRHLPIILIAFSVLIGRLHLFLRPLGVVSSVFRSGYHRKSKSHRRSSSPLQCVSSNSQHNQGSNKNKTLRSLHFFSLLIDALTSSRSFLYGDSH